MRIALFLLDTLFFFLVAAALLRGWMNTRRLRMTQQPGPFVIAVTDWIVQPLRRALPRRWAQANTDWGSLLAALLLSLAHAGLLALMTGLDDPLRLAGLALHFLLRTGLQGLMVLLLAYAVLSWVQPMAPVLGLLGRLLEPLLTPVRRVIPTVGGVDLSVLVLLIGLQVALMLLG
ncbi:YGGT family protein [Tepidimonas alkaliphilus]|uniref:YGGT family protein n=1 Tax=Tepidimonas alkaliphilus TaxID=2588942 RepID=A0A554WDJ8_9BURK|nr:YggT family protein [Tepidimonas alkaliphilus]TSE21644.1 YGGT family protein [Tepidimonas alkaliphilus]